MTAPTNSTSYPSDVAAAAPQTAAKSRALAASPSASRAGALDTLDKILDEVAAWLIAGAIISGLVFGVPALVGVGFGGGR